MLGKDYAKDTFDLKELDLHNGIEHDASLTRTFGPAITPLDEAFTFVTFTGQDVALELDQGKPHVPFIEELLAEATGKDEEGRAILTIEDMSRYSTKRRVEARETNPKFTLEKIHKTFGSTK